MNTEHIDPFDNRELSQEDAHFLRHVNLLLGVRRCRECGFDIGDRPNTTDLCTGCAEDRFMEYHLEYEKAAWQRTRLNRISVLTGIES